jgi:hypothetical protein
LASGINLLFPKIHDSVWQRAVAYPAPDLGGSPQFSTSLFLHHFAIPAMVLVHRFAARAFLTPGPLLHRTRLFYLATIDVRHKRYFLVS